MWQLISDEGVVAVFEALSAPQLRFMSVLLNLLEVLLCTSTNLSTDQEDFMKRTRLWSRHHQHEKPTRFNSEK